MSWDERLSCGLAEERPGAVEVGAASGGKISQKLLELCIIVDMYGKYHFSYSFI